MRKNDNSVLDLNQILLFIACVSPLIVLARTSRGAALDGSWRLAAVAVLVVTAFAITITPRNAGFVGGGAWLLLLFLPAFGLRRAAEFAAEQRFSSAGRIVGLLRFLHPLEGLRDERRLMRGLELAQLGKQADAKQILTELAGTNGRAGKRAAAHLFRIAGDWEGLVTWSQRNLPGMGLGEDPVLLSLYFRSLGETGRREQLITEFRRSAHLLVSPVHQQTFLGSLMLLFAFCGRTTALRSLFADGLRRLSRDAKEFWIGTSELAAGATHDAGIRLRRLQDKTTDAMIRADAKNRLAGDGVLGPVSLTPFEAATVSHFERNAEKQAGSLLAPRAARPASAVMLFIALNVAMFSVELALGGSTNDFTLHRLGALEPSAVFSGGQYWRLLSALFLHYGVLHLLFNCYALYVLGPSLEAAIGSFRFSICYIVSGLGSSAGVITLWRLGLTQADFLVGASGCVMGLVGVWAGLLLGHRHAPVARRRLLSILLIVAMQTAFDLFTPQVSMAAHLCGLFTGVLVGLVMAPAHEL